MGQLFQYSGMADRQSSRRRFLATAVAVSAVGLSGCGSGGNATTTAADGADDGSGDSSEGETSEPDTPEPTPEPTDTAEPADTPEPTDTPTSTPEQGRLTGWPSYQVNAGNWGHRPDAVGPHESVSTAWTVDVDQKEVNSAPILVDGTLYVGGGGPGDNRGAFYAIDAESGEIAWSKQLDAPVTGGAAFAETNYADLICVGTGSGLIEAYEPDGSTFWEYEIQSNEVLTAPLVGDGNIYFGSNAARLFKFDATDGTQKWSFDLTGEVTGGPAWADGTIVISSKDDKVYGVSQSGDEEWSNNLGADVNGVAHRDRTTYATPSTNGTAALSSAGRTNWETPVGARVLSPPAVTDSHVYAGTEEGYLVAVGRDSGSERWRFEEPSAAVSAPPVVADGTVYFGAQDSRLYAVDTESGEMEWSEETGDNIDNAAPVVAGGMVFVGSDDGTVYAFSES